MKTITKEEIVSNKTLTTTYICDFPGCSYETPVFSAIEEHEFHKHQLKCKKQINGVNFFLIMDQQDLSNVIKYQHKDYDYLCGDFVGAGWYGIDVYVDYEHFTRATLNPLSDFVKTWEKEAVELQNAIKLANSLSDLIY